MFPADLKLKAQREAKRQGISFGQYVRLCLEKAIIPQKTPRRRFFPNFDFTFIDDVPPDISGNLDKYLDKWDEEDEQRTKAAQSRSKRKKISRVFGFDRHFQLAGFTLWPGSKLKD